MKMPRMSIILVLALALTACGNRDRDVTLTNIKKTGDGPDEFTILPGKQLQTPLDFSNLPAPVPGGANLTDPNPKADGIAALGGNPVALNNAGVGAGDGALVNHARRRGADSGIRQTLATEDAEIRRRHGRVDFFRIGLTDDYTDSYKKQWLDAHNEELRLRRRNVQTPSAPPPK